MLRTCIASGGFGELCYNLNMVSKVLKEVIERVETWPENRQDAAAHVLMEMEAQDASPHRLSDEQVAEVQRRIADPNPKFVTLHEVRHCAALHEGDLSRRGVG